MNNLELFNQALDEYLSNDKTKLKEMKEYVLKQEAKRIRPLLVMEWCQIAGGNVKKAVNLALAVELLHNASLIYDDSPCMDNEEERHGVESCHKKFGFAKTLLLGVTLLSDANKLVMQSGLREKKIVQILEILENAVTQTVEGQYMEFDDKEEPVYLLIDIQKTSPLFDAACQIGVIAADEYDEDVLHQAHIWGYNFGVSYQIIDDIKDNDGLRKDLSQENCLDIKKAFSDVCELVIKGEQAKSLEKFYKYI